MKIINFLKIKFKKVKKKTNVLFVCTGNTCRSPMAEAIAKKVFGTKKYDFRSAGMITNGFNPVSENAVVALQQLNIGDISQHTSQPLTKELVDKSDYVFVMTESHKINFYRKFPKARCCVLNENGIADPFMKDINTYIDCAWQIQKSMYETVLKYLKG